MPLMTARISERALSRNLTQFAVVRARLHERKRAIWPAGGSPGSFEVAAVKVGDW